MWKTHRGICRAFSGRKALRFSKSFCMFTLGWLSMVKFSKPISPLCHHFCCLSYHFCWLHDHWTKHQDLVAPDLNASLFKAVRQKSSQVMKENSRWKIGFYGNSFFICNVFFLMVCFFLMVWYGMFNFNRILDMIKTRIFLTILWAIMGIQWDVTGINLRTW